MPLPLPPDKTAALAESTKRVDRETVSRFAGMFTIYDTGTEGDLMWLALIDLQSALAEAGFNPR
jgi:hypothetical protein